MNTVLVSVVEEEREPGLAGTGGGGPVVREKGIGALVTTDGGNFGGIDVIDVVVVAVVVATTGLSSG